MAAPQLGYQQGMGVPQMQQIPGGLRQPLGATQMMPIGPMGVPNMGTPQQGGPPPNQVIGPQKEMNIASLCRLGQETVQEIVSKTTELFQILKIVQLPNGTAQSLSNQKDRKDKVQEQLRSINMLFKRLRLIYIKCNENCAGMEYIHIESLIPIKDEGETRPEERKLTESMRHFSEEHREIAEVTEVFTEIAFPCIPPYWEQSMVFSLRINLFSQQVIQRSKHLKEIIDLLRNIIWEVNTMLAMRKP